MKTKLIYPLIATLALAGTACRGDRSNGASQKQYETVQEGSAAGVTSTISGPGEVVPPLTGTNADTTNSFTLNTNTAAQPSGTLAGTLPPGTYPPSNPSALPTGTYTPPMTRSTPATEIRQPVVITRSRPAASASEMQPPPETTATTTATETAQQVPPPAGDTTATQQPPTETAPPPPPAEQPKPKQQQDKPPAQEDEQEQTETAAPPPPPPPA